MKTIGRFKELNTLFLDSPIITGKGLLPLTDLKSLYDLNLVGATITDEDLPVLARITSLRSLGLSNTKITVDGLL